MNIYEEIKDVCCDKKGIILTSSEIKDLVCDKYGEDRTSVLPPDYCYNSINSGIAFDKHIFIRHDYSEYKYIGENQPYTGPIIWRSSGDKQERIIGKWNNGKYVLWVNPGKVPDEKIKRK